MKKIFVLLQAVLFCVLAAFPPPSGATEADKIIEKSNLAYYYAGRDGRARVVMTIKDALGRTRTRELTLLRHDVSDGGRQNYYAYFHRPPDVEGMIFMVWKNIGKDDDRWLYVPAIDLVKRVSAADKRGSFAGSHFTYEDVSGRHPDDDVHELLREERVDGKSAFVIKNTPKDPGSVEFSYYIVWIDGENMLPMRGEYYDKAGKLYKTMTSEEVRAIEGFPTITKARAEEAGGGSTVVEFTDIDYDVGLTEDIFTERYLRRSPRKWIK